MPSPVPTPVAAALGLVPTVLSGVRRLPGKAVQLPVLAVSSGLMALDHARREYDDLAQRGERLLARLRGTSFDELEDRVEDRLQGTPLARPYDAVEDALEDAGEAVQRVAKKAGTAARSRTTRATGTVSDLSERAAQKAADAGESAADAQPAVAAEKATKKAAKKVAETAGDAAGAAAEQTEKAAAKAAPAKKPAAEKAAAKAAPAKKPAAEKAVEEQPKGEPTPKASQPDDTPVDTAATADVVETVEQVSEQADAPAVTSHEDLPLPDYDHMTLGSLRGRLRSLTVDELVQVRDYEKAHANRLPVVTMLDNRIAKLATDSTAAPSGDPTAVAAPEKARSAKGGSKVTPATGGPAQNPPTAGVPTNPAQPRTAGPGTNPSSNA